MKTYRTVQGDRWDGIAYKTMGNSLYMDKLILANPQYKETYLFPAGIILNIPDIPEPEPAAGMPPWRR